MEVWIRDKEGNPLFTEIFPNGKIPVTQECQLTEELRKPTQVQLSFVAPFVPVYTDEKGVQQNGIPVGATISIKVDEFGWKTLRLYEPYTPTQQDELSFKYTPLFYSEEKQWSQKPFFFYTDVNGKVTQEPDWELTGNASYFMECVVTALTKQMGGDITTYSFVVSDSLPASAYVKFESTDILSGLNAIADAFETEWYYDGNGTLYLGKVYIGDAVTLEVGNNIAIPSISNKSEGFYNTFYAFGSTRNITNDYEGLNVTSIVNKRLTLSPKRFPYGVYSTNGGWYKYVNGSMVEVDRSDPDAEFRTNLGNDDEAVKILFFDKVYPRATEDGQNGIKISDVKFRQLYRVDDEGEKIKVGTDENGNPIYEQYAIWYFRLPFFEESFAKQTGETDEEWRRRYAKYIESLIIPGTTLTGSFESGALQGWEFELAIITEDTSKSDEFPFDEKAGMLRIEFVEENNVIIPTIPAGALIPQNGDYIALFNISLPTSYIEAAQQELEDALVKEVEKNSKDQNTYTANSNPVAFQKNNPNLSLGQKVIYKNGSYTFETRVTKLVTQMDYPCEQTITFGENVSKGTISQLKEAVVSANSNIGVLAELNKQTNSLLSAYSRAHEAMMQGFSAIKNMWRFDEANENTIYSPYNIWSEGAVSSKGMGGSGEGGTVSGIDLEKMWLELATADTTKLIDFTHMPSKVKTASNWVESVMGSDNDSVIDKWDEIVAFLAGVESTTLNGILNTFAKKSDVTIVRDSVSALSNTVSVLNSNKADASRVTVIENNYVAKTRKITAGTGLSGGGDLSADRTLSLATVGTSGTYTKVVVDAYGRVTGNSTLLESDIPALSIGKITNLQSTINTINANFANYLPLTGGAMKNTNLVSNLNADLLDGYNADTLIKGQFKVNAQVSVSAAGWYTIASVATNGFNERGTIHFAIRATGGDFTPYVNHYNINSSWSGGESSILTNGIGGFISGVRLTQIGVLNNGTRCVELYFSKAFTGYLVVLYSAYDNDGIINDNFTWNTGVLPLADTSAEIWKTLDIWNGINTDKQIRTTSTVYANSLIIGGATITWDSVNGMLKVDKGAYFLGPVSTKGVSNDTGTDGTGVDLSAVWQSLTTNTDAYGTAKIHIDHIPTLTSAKISDFASTVESLLPTNVSQFANDAGYITSSAIINKADKATTIQDYGLWEKYTDLNDAPMGAFFCGGTSVANSPESGNFISGITLARDKNTSFRTQLGFVSERLFTRQENNTNKWSSWKELAFKATTLAGYGITDALSNKNSDYYLINANSTADGGVARMILLNNNIAKIGIGFNGTNSYIIDYTSGKELSIGSTLKYGNNEVLTTVNGVTLGTGQTITGEKIFQQGTGTVPLRIRNTVDSAFIQAGSSGTHDTASLSISGLNVSMLTSLQVYATNTAFHGSISTTKISGITDTGLVANLNAQYLGGLNKDNFQKAIYDYINVLGTANTTNLPTVLAPSNYDGTHTIGLGNFKFYDTKFYSSQSNTANRTQLAYGYDEDSIHFRRYKDGIWNPWKEVAFTDVDLLSPASGTLTVNNNISVLNSLYCANGNISLGVGGLQISPDYANVNIGDYLLVNNGTTEIWGDSFIIGATSTEFTYNVYILGSASISNLIEANANSGILSFFGDRIDINAPVNAKSTFKIGEATLSWDSANGMLKVDKGAYFMGPVSTKGFGYSATQFCLFYSGGWEVSTTVIPSYGNLNNLALVSGSGTTNDSVFAIRCDAFSGKTPIDIETFVAPITNDGYDWTGTVIQFMPYQVVGNVAYFRLLTNGSMQDAMGVKIKVY